MNNNKLKGQGGLDLNTFLVLGILVVISVIIFNSLSTSFTNFSDTNSIVNESFVANTTFPATLANVPLVPDTQVITNTTDIFIEGSDYTFVDATGVITWLNLTANETSLDATYTFIIFADSTSTANANVTELFLNISTQLPIVGTIIGITILLFVIGIGIVAFARRGGRGFS